MKSVYKHRCSSSYAGTMTLKSIVGLSFIDGNSSCLLFSVKKYFSSLYRIILGYGVVVIFKIT